MVAGKEATAQPLVHPPAQLIVHTIFVCAIELQRAVASELRTALSLLLCIALPRGDVQGDAKPFEHRRIDTLGGNLLGALHRAGSSLLRT